MHTSFPDGSDNKESACNAGDPGLIPYKHALHLIRKVPSWLFLLKFPGARAQEFP